MITYDHNWRNQGAPASWRGSKGEQKLKQMQSGSSSGGGLVREATTDNASLALTRDTIAYGYWCIRVGDCAGLTQMWRKRWDLWNIPMFAVKRELSFAALLIEVRAQRTSAPPQSCRCWTAHVGEWAGSSRNKWSYLQYITLSLLLAFNANLQVISSTHLGYLISFMEQSPISSFKIFSRASVLKAIPARALPNISSFILK